MYLHVPSVLTAYLAFGLVLVGSIVYLATRRAAWDRLAAVGGGARRALHRHHHRLGVHLGSSPTWGTWWTWDARLTSTAVLFIVYVGYLLLRAMIEDPERARPLRGGRRHRRRRQHAHRPLLGQLVARAPSAVHHSRDRSPRRSRRRSGWRCWSTGSRSRWSSPTSSSRRVEIARLEGRALRERHARQLGLRLCGLWPRSGGAARLLALPVRPDTDARRAEANGERRAVSRRVKFIAGGLIIVAALGYLVYAGVSQSIVYFVTPSELQAAPVLGQGVPSRRDGRAGVRSNGSRRP